MGIMGDTSCTRSMWWYHLITQNLRESLEYISDIIYTVSIQTVKENKKRYMCLLCSSILSKDAPLVLRYFYPSWSPTIREETF